MTKKELLKHLQNDVYCRIGVSKIHGVGVIAIRDIPKGTNPFSGSFKGKYIAVDKKEILQFPEGVQKMIHDFFAHEKNKVYIPENGLNNIDISFFLNQTDSPNVATHDGDIFITTRNIKKGEELSVDYTTYDDNS